MRLLAKATVYYLLVALVFLGLGGVLIYFNTSKLIDRDIRNFLINREEIATTQIINGENISGLNNYEQKVKLVDSGVVLDSLFFKDTLIYDIIDDKYQPYLKLSVNRRIGENHYQIDIYKSLLETRLLVYEIFFTEVLVFCGLIVVMIFLNLAVSRNLWKPFKKTLFALTNYQLGGSQQIEVAHTDTTEFKQLNEIIESMTQRIRRDYLNLKEFTENASHEIQTPLAVVQSKSEMLMQSEKMDEAQLMQIKAIYDAANRLSKMNQGLLLLAKIENQQYLDHGSIDMTQLITNIIDDYQEMAELNQLSIHADLKEGVHIKINSDLGQVLVSNLVRNAIRHSKSNGVIDLTLTDQKFVVVNTGDPIDSDSIDIFERFSRFNSQSIGLGLAIVSKICEHYDIRISHKYESGLHNFILEF